MTLNASKKKGFVHRLDFDCISCDWSMERYTSEKVKTKEDSSDSPDDTDSSDIEDDEKRSSSSSHFDLNIRAVLVFREMGRGLTGMKSFCEVMDMSSPMSKSAFDSIISKVHVSYVKTAQESMLEAAQKIVSKQSEPIANVTASFDGTWQKRGYASLNGVVTGISNDKCIDYEVLTKRCNACTYWLKNKDKKGYENWM